MPNLIERRKNWGTVSPGQPRLITTERIVEAGKRIILPRLSIRGAAKELGVSEMSVYRIVEDLEGLRAMVAEGIVTGHVFPKPTATDSEDAFVKLAHTPRDFVITNPGTGQHLTRLTALRHELTIRLAEGQQAAFASRFGYPPAQASLLVSTVAEHAIALGEINLLPHNDTALGPLPEQAPTVRTGAELIAPLSPRERFEWSIRATARGSILLLDRENLVARHSSPETAPEGAK